MNNRVRLRGFTLIELSIVLVIIGLLVGGVLAGRDIIKGAETRATLTQLEKYNQAVNTFRVKYGYLPGDMPITPAVQFGFATRGTARGEGDGNGTLEGVWNGVQPGCTRQGAGETPMFWVDLSAAHLIEGMFNTASSTTTPGTDIVGSALDAWLPQAKLGNGNYFYVYGMALDVAGTYTPYGGNYFGLSSGINIAGASNEGLLYSNADIPVSQAYAIDKKIDDGQPQSGGVVAWYMDEGIWWTDGTNALGTPNQPVPYSGALAGSSTTCYDNNNVSGAITNYSMTQNNGQGQNCALSFKFQ